MANSFHELSVCAVEPQGSQAVAISFAVPPELGASFRFDPGQYLTLEAEIGGRAVRRTYSICSSKGDPILRVGVRKVNSGRFSTHANTQIRVGDLVRVMVPHGRLGLEIGGRHDYLLIAAGSGITPLFSIAASVLENERESTVCLLYGNRSSDSIMFREELEDLKDRYIGRMSLLHVLSREGQDSDVLNGRLDERRIRLLARAGLISPSLADGIFLCGPGNMIDELSDTLLQMGVEEGRIRFERFTPSRDASPQAGFSSRVHQAAENGVRVEVVLDGSRRSFVASDPEISLIECAHREGIELPHSCTAGMCCTCRCRIVEGSAEMAVNYSLQPWEIEFGFTLACQARPTSRKLVLDFDAL